MNTVYTICALIAGLGAFLIGVNMLSENIEKLATSKLRSLFAKSSKSKLVGVGIGTLTTAVVQSSSVTTVMVVGLVNAGVMSLLQATAVMMGANIGTTITAQIAALQTFKFADIAIGLAGVGIFMVLFGKKDKTKYIGEAVAGLGLIFVGLALMSDAMSVVKESEIITDLLGNLTNPIVLLLAGAVITAIVQSSSAVTAIVISMVGAGIVIGGGGNSPLYIILGTNIGTCITALMSAIGATTNGKRASIIHLLFNVIGSLIFFVILLLWPNFNDNVLAVLFPYATTQLAMFHTIFNVTCTLLFLPLSKYFVMLATLIVKDKPENKQTATALDVRLLSSPAVALNSVGTELASMVDDSIALLHTAYSAFTSANEGASTDIMEQAERIDQRGRDVSDYLVKLSSGDISHNDEVKVSQYHHNVGDTVRLAELAENLTKYTHRLVKDQLTFSPTVLDQLAEMLNLIDKLAKLTSTSLLQYKIIDLAIAEDLENNIDTIRKQLTKDHIARLQEGTCNVANSRVFFNLVSNLERTGDHLIMIVRSI